MNAVEMNVSGNSSTFIAPISVSSLRTTRASPFESAPTVTPSSAPTAIMPTTPSTPLAKSAPTTSASATMISDWIPIVSAACPTRPTISADRLTGVPRKRSITPRSMSWIMVIPLQPAEKKAVMTTTPGVKKSV